MPPVSLLAAPQHLLTHTSCRPTFTAAATAWAAEAGSAAAATATTGSASPDEGSYAPGQVLVRLRPPAPGQARAASAQGTPALAGLRLRALVGDVGVGDRAAAAASVGAAIAPAGAVMLFDIVDNSTVPEKLAQLNSFEGEGACLAWMSRLSDRVVGGGREQPAAAGTVDGPNVCLLLPRSTVRAEVEVAEPNWARRLIVPQRSAGAAAASRRAAAMAAGTARPAATPGAVLPNDLEPEFLGPLWHLYRVSAPLAWATTRGSRAVRACVIDTGILRGHEDFSDGRIIGGWNRWVARFSCLAGWQAAGVEAGGDIAVCPPPLRHRSVCRPACLRPVPRHTMPHTMPPFTRRLPAGPAQVPSVHLQRKQLHAAAAGQRCVQRLLGSVCLACI